MALGGFFGGNFGAGAAGAMQGQADYQQRLANQNALDMRQLQMQQVREQQTREAAARNAQAAATDAFRKTMQSAYGVPGAPQAPAPGTPSTPMQQPAAAPAGAPPVQPWQTLPQSGGAGMGGQQPVVLPARPQPAPAAAPAATPSQQLTMSGVMANAPSDPEAFRAYMAEMAPYLAQRAEWSEPFQLDGATVQRNTKTGEVRQAVRTGADKGDWSEPYQLDGATVQKNTKSGQIRKVVGPAGGGAGGAGNLGHLNAFKARETKDLAPVTDAQMKSAKIKALLQSGNAVGTAQVQQALSDLYTHLRATNQIYADSKSFGNIEQRFANALNRFVSGKYSSDDRNMILSLLDEMNNKVFSPARKNIVTRYRTQAKTFGYDPSVADESDSYSPAETPTKPSAAVAPPAGFTVMD